MVTVEDIRNAQRAEGPATVLAIGTANPPNVFYQSTYPDYFFRMTNSEHKTDLKKKFQRICEGSAVEKRYMYFNEDILKANPNVCEYKATSLNFRQKIVVEETPKLAKESALKALKEWGQPLSKITHLVFCSTSGVEMPGIDHKLIKLLGLQPSVKRVMLYHIGCFAGGKVLRVAKDLAENNKGARVLVVSAELSVITFHGPCETHLDNLVGQAIFGDGSAALVVGSDPLPGEKPLFEFVSAAQNILPDSEGAIMGHLREAGLIFHLSKNVPKAICNSIEKALVKAFEPLGISDWNSIFYIPHPGGRAILDQMETRLGLKPEKFQAARYSLAKYGNMSSASVLFVMDRMRKQSAEEGAKTTGEGCEWGAVLGFGPGLTLETVVLHSVAI